MNLTTLKESTGLSLSWGESDHLEGVNRTVIKLRWIRPPWRSQQGFHWVEVNPTTLKESTGLSLSWGESDHLEGVNRDVIMLRWIRPPWRSQQGCHYVKVNPTTLKESTGLSLSSGESYHLEGVNRAVIKLRWIWRIWLNRCKVQIDSKQERKRLFHSKPEPLRVCKQIVNEFKIDLQNRYAALEEQQDDSNNSISLNDMINNITEPLIGAGKKWKSSTKRNSKFSEETKNFMEKRRNLKTPTTAKEKIEATELNKLIRKKQRNDLRKHKATTIQRVIEQGKSFKMAKRQLNRGRLQFTSVLEEDGTLTTDRERIVERSREFYKKLYSSTRQEPPEADIEQQFEGFPNIKAWEVKSAVKQSKKGKAPGPDNITIDLIDAAGDIINDKLATLFNECLIQSKVPEIWNEAIIILLHKKGDQKNISNYRPISLLNNIYKLFTKIITNRITRTLDENQPREQAGFRRGFSTIDHLHAVNQLIEKCAEYKIPLVVGLVDYNKAFDSVEIPDVIEALQEQGVDPVYVNVLKHIYKQAKSFIRLHKDSKPFQVSRGVRQGDTSSPKLFTACLEKVFRKLNWSRRGILIDGEYLSHLRFADDIIIFTRNIAELHEMLQELNQASLEVGLSMNFKKTKIMCNKHAEDTNRKITIDNNEIEEVDHYIYLGQRISMQTASKEHEIKRRITLGWQAFGRASAIFKNKEIPTCLKRQVYNQCIIPTVTYGSETWNLTKIQTMKLRSMQRAHERIMLNITWRDHKTAEWIREQTKLRDILETISKAKWTWAGHLTRRTDNRWTTKLTFWQPRGHTRNKGRPKFRWRDDLDKFRKHWHRDTSDRLRWRQMGKAYVQLRTFKGWPDQNLTTLKESTGLSLSWGESDHLEGVNRAFIELRWIRPPWRSQQGCHYAEVNPTTLKESTGLSLC